MRLHQFTFKMRRADPFPYRVASVCCGTDDKHEVQITESPFRRSVQVHVNGKKVYP